MQQFQSLKRLLIFYKLTLLIMLTIYYAMMFLTLKDNSEQYTVKVFDTLQYELVEIGQPTDSQVLRILNKPLFKDFSYQLVFMLPSGQTYVHHHTYPNERRLSTVIFPNMQSDLTDTRSTYNITHGRLEGFIYLKSGEKFSVAIRHQPIAIHWTSYRYWLPLMSAIVLSMMAILYLFKRRADWQQLLLYSDSLTTTAKNTYVPSPFNDKKTTTEFLHIGQSLSRMSDQLHQKHRRMKTLSYRLQRLVDRAPLPMLTITRQGHVNFFNRRFEQVFITAFERGTTYTLTDFFTGSDDTIQQHLHNITSQRIMRTLLVYGLKDKQAYQLHITPWFSEHEQTQGFTVMLNNVSKFIHHNTDLVQKNQQSQQQIVELINMRSVIAHELRMPLNAIISTLDLIDPKTLCTNQKSILTALTQTSQSMLTMLNDMLDIEKSKVDKVGIAHAPTDIFQVSYQVSDLMVSRARRHDLELVYFFSPDCPRYITTDTNRLHQIILNLIDNAIKFTSSGYVALLIEPATEQRIQQLIDNSVDTDNNYILQLIRDPVIDNQGTNSAQQPRWIRFSVTDTGIGIKTAEQQQQLFSCFNQANPQIEQNFEDTGLGLAISNSFAQLLGGFIWLDSDNSGSSFTLYLPCYEPTYQPVYHPRANLKHIHLIAIVNQPLNALYLQQLCQHLGIKADIYDSSNHNTQATIAMLQQQIPNVKPILLLDYEYYVTTIIDTANSRYSDTDTDTSTDIKVTLYDLIQSTTISKILLSMQPERGIPSNFLDKFDGFLTKPVNVGLLLSELSRLAKPTAQRLAAITSLEDTTERHFDTQEIKSADNPPALDAPLADVDATALEPVEPVEPLILVVEDNVTNQKITCKLLSKLGYQSIVAENGQEAVEMLAKQRQDIALILMDCRMPIMDGLQATKEIRASGDNIAIVALTANNTDEDRDACIGVGMDEFLAKPINKNKLQAVLQHFLSV